MKSQRRHELQTNQLADWLGQNIEKVRPYSKALLGGLILVLALVLVFAIVKNRRESRQLTAWSEYMSGFDSGDPEELAAVGTEYSGTDAAAWSRLVYANSQAQQGMAELFTDHQTAQETLRTASDVYGTLLGSLSSSQKEDPLLAGRAHLQLAQVREVLEDFEGAVSNYELVAEQWPDHAVGQQARAALERLERLQGARYYEAFYDAPPPAQVIPDELPPTEFGEGDGGGDSFDLPPEADIRPTPFDFGTPAEDGEGTADATEPFFPEADELPGGESPAEGTEGASDTVPPPVEGASDDAGEGSPAGEDDGEVDDLFGPSP